MPAPNRRRRRRWDTFLREWVPWREIRIIFAHAVLTCVLLLAGAVVKYIGHLALAENTWYSNIIGHLEGVYLVAVLTHFLVRTMHELYSIHFGKGQHFVFA